jgi:hypothetical protein
MRFSPRPDGKMEIEVEEENGVKTVTVTKENNGQETVEVLTGDEADRFLAHHDKMRRMHHGEDNVFVIAFENDDNSEKTSTKIFKKDGQVIMVKNNVDATVISKDGNMNKAKIKALLMKQGVTIDNLTFKSVKSGEHDEKHEIIWTECTKKQHVIKAEKL